MTSIEKDGPAPGMGTVSLTERERVVLANLADGLTLEEVAIRLFVTRNTVKSQVRSLYSKLGVSNRADAVAWARQAGLRATDWQAR